MLPEDSRTQVLRNRLRLSRYLDAHGSVHFHVFDPGWVRATIEGTDGAPLAAIGSSFSPMSSKVHCYLRTQRREWGLTQEEVASLLPKGSRNRVSRVERGLVPPNAQEILAYRLIFGSSVPVLFPRFHTQTVDVVIQRAYRLHNRVRGKSTLADQRKHKLTELMLARATGKAKPQKV